MTQISRPFVIALAAVVLFAAVWFVALKPHTSSTSSTEASSSAPTPAQASATQEKAAVAPSHVDHTSTPGLEGLTKDINRAHSAVAAAQGSATHNEEKAAQVSGTSSTPASSPAPTTATKSTPSAAAGSAAKSSAGTAAAAAASKSASSTHASGSEAAKPSTSSAQGASSRIPAGQALVEAALKENRVALILFWNPKSAEDQLVRLYVKLVAGVHEIVESLATNPKTSQQVKKSGIKVPEIAVFEDGPSAVASYGSFTRTVQVYQTPTILVVNPLGQITSIPGYTESRAIEQRIGESREAAEQSPAKAGHAGK